MSKDIKTIAERIEEKFGGKWEKAGKSILQPPPSIPTGSILLDQAIGDCLGWPEGSILEFFGPQHSGKTLLGYLAIAASQSVHLDRDHMILDAENQFKFQARWAQQVGVNVADLYIQPTSSAEEAFDKLEMAILGDVELDKDGNVKRVVKAGNFGVILVDSVTQLTPLEMIHKSMDEKSRMAALAAVMSHGLKKVVSAMSTANSKTIIIFVNQTRANPNAMFGNPETRTGGNALPFYDTIAVRVSKVKKSEERDEKGKIFAHQVKVKFEKNKAGQIPANPIIFRLRYDGTGIDNDYELCSVAEMNKLLQETKRGKCNFFKPGTDELLNDKIEDFKKEEFGTVIKANPQVKDMIMNFVKEGSFYASDAIEEDNPDAEESIPEKQKDEKTELEQKKVEKEELTPGTENKDSQQKVQEPQLEKLPEQEQKKKDEPDVGRTKRRYRRRKGIAT